MSRAAPLRFVGGVVALWIVGRTLILERPGAPPAMAATTALAPATPPLLLAAARDPSRAAARVPLLAPPAPVLAATETLPRVSDDEATMLLLVGYARGSAPVDDARPVPAFAALTTSGIAPGARYAAPSGSELGFDGPSASVSPGTLGALRSRWSGEAYVFARGRGGGDALGGGTLGGGQAAARIAYRIDAAGRIGLFARGYAPLHGSGAEVSAGVEAHPLDGVPLRLAIERRQRADHAGRSAWEASAAAGVDAAPLPGGLRLDGYGQAGMVGAKAGDLFADGSVRVGKPLPVAAGSLTVGAGLWGAAQPGAARLDLGPQAALRLPEGRTTLTVAADWRLRAAGDARPGSGPALTLAADF